MGETEACWEIYVACGCGCVGGGRWRDRLSATPRQARATRSEGFSQCSLWVGKTAGRGWKLHARISQRASFGYHHIPSLAGHHVQAVSLLSCFDVCQA
jgi:hypothetical protein